MAESAHAYVRGNTIQFYEWLHGEGASLSIPVGPPIWICGDCHIGNLGPIADLEGKVEIQIRDLDQTVMGNPAHDLLRLGLSLAMAARSSDLPGLTTALMVEVMIDGYIHGLPGGKPGAEAEKIPPIQKVMRSAVSRQWRNLAKEHLRDVTPKIPLGKKLWPLTESERKRIDDLFDEATERDLVNKLNGGEDDTPIKVVDAAYWVKGCSSLGRLRYAVLLAAGKKGKRTHRLIDVKEATKAVAPRLKGSPMPMDNAKRVVMGAEQLSPFLGERMVPSSLGDHQVVIRELRPQDLKFEFASITQNEAIRTAQLLAGVVGKAHGRQMTVADRSQWSRTLKAGFTKSLEAPSWLWNGVVDLVAAHEASYLRHCRSFALSQTKEDVVVASSRSRSKAGPGRSSRS